MLKEITGRLLRVSARCLMKYGFRSEQLKLNSIPASCDYRIVEKKMETELRNGWQRPAVARQQHEAFAFLIRRMHKGKAREDFIALAKAMEKTDSKNPLVVEIGCGSGWNFEVMEYLANRPFRYIGLDYSYAMISLGKECYPKIEFVVGDGQTLPFKDRCCDILVSGTVLMHLFDYEKAVCESQRVTKKWCIFHTIPVLQRRKTTVLTKKAYGEETIEVIFNERHLLEIFRENGLVIREIFESISYDLAKILQEHTVTKTYVCQVSV